VVGDSVGPGVAGPQFHGQALGGVRAPGGQRVEAETALERGRRPFFLRGSGDDRCVHVDHDPALQPPPGHGQPGESAGPQVQQGTTRPGAPSAGPSPSASAPTRPGWPGCGGWWSPMRPGRTSPGAGQVVWPRSGSLRRARWPPQAGRRPRTLPPAVPVTHRQHGRERVGQPHPVRAPAQQHNTRMPDQPLAVGPHAQPTLPPCTLAHQKGAPTLASDTDQTLASSQVKAPFLLPGRQIPQFR